MARSEGRSFSASVKKELLSVIPEEREEILAELAGICLFSGGLDPAQPCVLAVTDSRALSRKVFTSVQKSFNINVAISKAADYTLRSPDEAVCTELRKVLAAPVEKDGCARAFARGAFLAAGSVTDPQKYYRLEITAPDPLSAAFLDGVLRNLSLQPKTTRRAGETVVYLQDGAQVSDMLGHIGAAKSLLALENVRVVKEVRGNINRRVNLETSNLRKAANASARQIRDIALLEQSGRLMQLPESLQETARLRKENPGMSLAELGELFSPPLGRSGVNHRLRLLGSEARALRGS